MATLRRCSRKPAGACRSSTHPCSLVPMVACAIELGSLSQTTKNLLREGISGEYLFILPKHLFESKTNYADVEFLVYLNFFIRYGTRTRIVGTARQRTMLERLLRLTIFGLFDPHVAEQPLLRGAARALWRPRS